MNSEIIKHPKNVPGTYFCTKEDNEITSECIQCGLCPSNLPEVFAEDEDCYAYVHKQPESEYEIEITEELILDCPVGSIGKSSQKIST